MAVIRTRILYAFDYCVDSFNKIYTLAKINLIIFSLAVMQAGLGPAHSNEAHVQCSEISQDIIDAAHKFANEELTKRRIDEVVKGDEIEDVLRYLYLYYIILVQVSNDSISDKEKIDKNMIANNLPNYMVLENMYVKYSKDQVDELAAMLKRGVFSCDASDRSPLLEAIRFLAVLGGNYDLDRMPNWGEAAKVDARIMETYLDFLKYTGNMSYRNDVKEWYKIYGSCKDLNNRELCIADIRADLTKNMKSRRDEALKTVLCNVIVLVEWNVYTHRFAESDSEICGG